MAVCVCVYCNMKQFTPSLYDTIPCTASHCLYHIYVHVTFGRVGVLSPEGPMFNLYKASVCVTVFKQATFSLYKRVS